MKTAIIKASLIAFLLVIGCGKDKITHSDPTDNKGMAINLTMSEIEEGTSKFLVLNIATDRLMSCANFRILYDLRFRGPNPVIDILGTDLPDICATAFGPATASIIVGSLPVGVYAITINNGNNSLLTVIVTETSYQIDPEELHNLTINNSYLARDPG